MRPLLLKNCNKEPPCLISHKQQQQEKRKTFFEKQNLECLKNKDIKNEKIKSKNNHIPSY